MSHSPRLAVGTVQSGVDSQVMTWALLGALRQLGLGLQHFYSQSCLASVEGAASITGSGSRHLDSWLMSQEMCRELYRRAARDADIAIVEGRYASGLPVACHCGGTLDRLADWLSLPKLAIIDVTQLADCRLPRLAAETEGLLLDRVRGLRGLVLEKTRLEALYGIPVLGALPGLAHARKMIDRLPQGSTPAATICRELGNIFIQHAKLDQLIALADRPYHDHVGAERSQIQQRASGVRIAVAYDAAFNAYFNDALDQLELYGAEVIPFSPLKDEQLPVCDIVYLGTGQPDRFAELLSANQCMLSSLRNHYRRGGRIYAEGGGLAYLCQTLVAADGRRHGMVGALAAMAHRQEAPKVSEPLEVTLARGTWLAEAGMRVRGYANQRWRLEPLGQLASAVLEPRHQALMVATRGVVGSLLHINFAAQPRLLARFFDPWPGRLEAVLTR